MIRTRTPLARLIERLSPLAPGRRTKRRVGPNMHTLGSGGRAPKSKRRRLTRAVSTHIARRFTYEGKLGVITAVAPVLRARLTVSSGPVRFYLRVSDGPASDGLGPRSLPSPLMLYAHVPCIWIASRRMPPNRLLAKKTTNVALRDNNLPSCMCDKKRRWPNYV